MDQMDIGRKTWCGLEDKDYKQRVYGDLKENFRYFTLRKGVVFGLLGYGV